jgi:hypothetical protein
MDHSEQRERSADEREDALDVRESRVQAQESRQVERKVEVETVLANAARRDEVSDARDAAAGQRDMTANLQAWLDGNEGHAHSAARRQALDDRLHSKGDRTSSAADRSILAEDDAP